MIQRLTWLFLTLVLTACASTSTSTSTTSGPWITQPSQVRTLVPAQALENQAKKEYEAALAQAKKKGMLLPTSAASSRRVARMLKRLQPHAHTFLPRSQQWAWQARVVRDKSINAFCMPGGKIMVFTGLIHQLKLNDDELAVVLGHEMAHSLREHVREQIAKQQLTDAGARLLGTLIGADETQAKLLSTGSRLLKLRFSREDEIDADRVGLLLTARAGYDPRAALSLWNKMKKHKGQAVSLEWFSTHPSDNNRLNDLRQGMSFVLPEYARARGVPLDRLTPYAPSPTNMDH